MLKKEKEIVITFINRCILLINRHDLKLLSTSKNEVQGRDREENLTIFSVF